MDKDAYMQQLEKKNGELKKRMFSVPMSLGGLSNCEAQLVEALEQPYQQTLEHIRAQEVAHADETGWRRGNRQRGWLAHLKRDFKARSKAGGEMGQIGRKLYSLAKQILKMGARVRDGALQGRTFQRRMASLMRRVEKLLEAGASGKGAGRGKCRRIIRHRKSLWTFVHDQRVEPTNNAAERMVRQGVLRRHLPLAGAKCY